MDGYQTNGDTNSPPGDATRRTSAGNGRARRSADGRPDGNSLGRQVRDATLPAAVTLDILNNELEMNTRAQQRLAQEIEILERRQRQRVNGEMEPMEGRDFDYMRAKNYRPYFSVVILVTCVIMMIVELAENGFTIEPLNENPLIGPSKSVLIRLGAKDRDRIVDEDEWWRLFTPLVLHVGVIHLLLNMYCLIMLGIPLEQEFGTLRISFIFIVSGVYGVLMSAVFNPNQISVGASGAIFGLFGASWSDLIMNWSFYRNKAWSALLNLTMYTLINVTLGLLPFLDNFAHLGGLMAGFICGLTLLVQTRYTYEGARKGRRNYQLALQAISIILLPVTFVGLVLALYLEIDIAEKCSWCSKLSCVPFPPGASPGSRWWECDPCYLSESFASNISSIGFTLQCPNTKETNFVFVPNPFGPDQKENEDLLLNYCLNFC